MALQIQPRGGVGSSSSAAAGTTFEDFLDNLSLGLSQQGAIDDISNFIDGITYKGFDAKRIRDLAIQKFKATGILKLVTIGALRGSAAVSLAVKSGGDPDLHSVMIDMQSGEPKSIQQLYTGRTLWSEKNSAKVLGKTFLRGPCTTGDHLTIQRLVAAFPDMAAYGLMQVEKRGSLSKRVQTDLPAWLIFPAAASLPFENEHREVVRDMCVRFSELIGGTFDAGIFNLQWANREPFIKHAIHMHIQDIASSNKVKEASVPFNFVFDE